MKSIKKALHKLFFGIEMTWPRIIVSAVLIAVYTAAVLLIPAFRLTSVRDIGGDIPCWIMFAMIIICNCKTAKEAAAKTFVFFLISQPLIYLFQVPFSEKGWSLFSYYPPWALWTLATVPMSLIGWHTRKKGWSSPLILSAMTCLLAVMAVSYLYGFLKFPPYKILSLIACLIFIFMLITGILPEKKQRIAAWCIVIAALAVSGCLMFRSGVGIAGGNVLLPDGVSYSDVASVSVADESIASAKCDDGKQEITVMMKQTGETELTAYDSDGNVLAVYRIWAFENTEFSAFSFRSEQLEPKP